MTSNKGIEANEALVHSRSLSPREPGELLSVPRTSAGWEWMSFFVRRLAAGEVAEIGSAREETALIVLGGRCRADWGEGLKAVGARANVFEGLPYALYLPARSQAKLIAETECELAVCSVPSEAPLEPRLITPNDVASSSRGGGNASRQIVDVIRPEFPADKLMVIEVYTPAGNWSSFPPHKHDVHNPPGEVDLDEIYYYRIDRPTGFAHQRLYTSDGQRDVTLTVHDGDLVLVKEGYHPVVAGHGYNVYYLNCLAGSARSLANTEDPEHRWVRSTWREVDSRLPLVKL